MEFGIIVPSQFEPDRDPTACLADAVRASRLAEDLGYDSLWVTEHHFTGDRCYFDNVQLLSYLASVTDSIAIGTCVCLVPQYNPVRLAERVANLDVLSDGRFVFGTGVGYRPEEFEVLGIDRSRRGARMTEALGLLRRLWTEKVVTHEGEEFAYDEVSINPKPVQLSGPEIWVGGRAPGAVRRAAELGDAWIIPSSIPFSDIEAPDRTYRETCAAGDVPERRAIMRETFVAETTAEAIERAYPSLAAKYESYAAWRDGQEWLDEATGHEIVERLAGDLFLVGSPADVQEQLSRYRDKYDVTTLVCRSHWPGLSVDAAEESVRLFADEVAPAFGAEEGR